MEQLKKLGFSAADIGISEEGEEDEKKARKGKCEIDFGTPESWLITKWQQQNRPKTVKLIQELLFDVA